MRLADGLREISPFNTRRLWVLMGITALSAATAGTALGATPSYPPAPDPRGPSAKQPKPKTPPATPAPASPAASSPAIAATPAEPPEPAAAPVPVAQAVPTAAPAATPASAAPASAAPASAGSSAATVPAQTPTEQKAARLSAEALGPLYRGRRFQVAETKLRDAIRICGPDVCSSAFSARLHRDLGFVYVDGMKRVDDGKDEFTVALSMDPTVTLTDSMLSLAVTQAFAETKKQVVGSSGEPKAEEVVLESEPEPAQDAEKALDEDSRRIDNWVSLTLQADFVFHSKTANACSEGSPYRCFDARNEPQPVVLYPQPEFQPGSNQVASGGAIFATTRVLAGYDRVITDNITVGARAGAVVSGKAVRLTTERSFLFFHGELRGAYWFGSNPFAHKGFRPYVLLAAGVGEADGKITVDVIYNGTSDKPANSTAKYAAWKRSGKTFAGAGAGIMWAIEKKGGPLAELRYLQFMGPNVPVLAFDIGYSLGF